MATMEVGPEDAPVGYRFRMRQVRTEVFEVDLMVRVPQPDALTEAHRREATEVARAVAKKAHAWREKDDATMIDWDPVTLVEIDGEGEEIGETEEV